MAASLDLCDLSLLEYHSPTGNGQWTMRGSFGIKSVKSFACSVALFKLRVVVGGDRVSMCV